MANIFMKLDSIQGESEQEGYNGWIECESVQYSVHSPSSVGTGTGSGVGKAEPSPITVFAKQGAHSPEISKRQYQGDHFQLVTIAFLKQAGQSTGQKFFEIKLKEVFVTLFNPSLQGNSEPYETWTFTYNDIETEYFKQNEQGNVVSAGKTGYNTKTNVAR